jgi:ribosome-binding factor A
METKRQKQVGELVRRNFGTVLLNEGGYMYGNALVTVTKVKMSPDLGIAKIYLSIYNTDNKQSVMLQLDHHLQKLRQSLAFRLKRHVRKAPYIELFIDDTLDEMYKLNELFDKLKSEKKTGGSDESE